jgi:acyl-CoA synthetase (NDP forming)
MTEPGVELILGVISDPQFGPVVMLGGGGIYAEVFKDAAFALPPFDAAVARDLLMRLKVRPLLEGARGRPRADIEALCAAAARLSVLAAELGRDFEAIDINPVIVHAEGCVAVDALIIPRASVAARSSEERKITDDVRAAQIP